MVAGGLSSNPLVSAGLVALSATAFILSFPPHHLPLLPWIALIPLLVAIRSARSTTAAVVIAAAWGLLAAYGITAWLPRAIANYWQQPFLLGLGLFVATSALMGSLQYGLFAGAYRTMGRSPSPLLVAAAWVAAELGRCRLFGGNPWGLIGYTLAPSSANDGIGSWAQFPAQVADLGGVYAVSFVVVACNAALAEAVIARGTSGAVWAPARRHLATSGILIVASMLYGWARLASMDAPRHSARVVAIVQGNVSLGTTWRPELYGRNFDVYLKGTARVLSDPPALVVWPENAMSFFAEDEPLYRNSLARVIEGSSAQLLAGGPSHTGGSSPQYFNSAFLFSPAGDIVARYDKEKLLPFAERFPFGTVAFLRRSFGRLREFTPGSQLGPLPTAAGRAGILICNEIMFDELVVDRVRAGAELLVNLSNDTWIGDELYSQNHLAIGAIRAIETRRFIVRASTSGPSAFIDRAGRALSISTMDQETVLRGAVAASSEITPFVRFGDAFALACVAAVVLRLAFALRLRSGDHPSGGPAAETPPSA